MNMPGGWLALASWMCALVAASLATWAACRWWYGRKLLAAAWRLQKSDKGRLFSQQQTLEARRQVELLKAELAAHQKAAVDSQADRQRTRELQAALSAAEVSAESDSSLMFLSSAQPASHGFADTQIMP